MKKNVNQLIFVKEVGSFLLDRNARGCSKRTLDFYRNELTYFGCYLEALKIVRMKEIEASILRQYFVKLGETRNKGGVHASYRSLKTFLNWYIEEHELDIRNPISKIKLEAPSKEPIAGIPLEDVRKLLAVCDKSFHGRRDKAIILFLLDSGLRREEMCNLNINDLDFQSGSVNVERGKGGKKRTTYVEAKTLREVTRYLRFRKDTVGEDPLWVSDERTRLTMAGLREVVRRKSVQAQVPEPRLHDFRRTFAIESLRNGCNIFSLMRMMGHSEPSVLQRYLALVEDDIEKAHKKSSPIENL
jgi:integrase/recombinase XerD